MYNPRPQAGHYALSFKTEEPSSFAYTLYAPCMGADRPLGKQFLTFPP